MRKGKYKPRRFHSKHSDVVYVEMPKVASNSIRYALGCQIKAPVKKTPKIVFTFVRHPLVRCNSAFVEKIQTGKYNNLVGPKVAMTLSRKMTLAEFVDFLLNYEHYESLNNHFCPQSWIVDSAPGINFIGRLEQAEQDWKRFVDERGLAPLPHKHQTKNIKSWKEVMDAETEAKARRVYADDFNRWPGWWD